MTSGTESPRASKDGAEESAKRIGGALGWGIAGQVVFGGAGLLAGLLLGGKGKDVTFVARFKDGRKILATTDSKTFTWRAAELAAFLESIREHRLHPAFLLAATTGMRRGEILGLRWSDIDFDRKRVSVCRSLVSVNYQLSFSDPKTPRSRRAIAIDETTLQVLRAHKKMQAKERLAFAGEHRDHRLGIMDNVPG